MAKKKSVSRSKSQKQPSKPQLVSSKPATSAKAAKKPFFSSDKKQDVANQANKNSHVNHDPSKPAFQLQPSVQNVPEVSSLTPNVVAAPKPASRAAEPVNTTQPQPEVESTVEITPKPQSSVTAETSSISSPRRRSGFNRTKLIRYGVGLALIVGLPLLGLFVMQHRENSAQTTNQRLVAAVKAKAIVPADETPAITTVVDPTQVNQQFLQGVQKGDKVLLYYQASRAVVYRPSTGQIVNMGVFSAPSPRVWLRSGAPFADVPKIGSESNANGDFVVISNDASARQDYKKTVVIDLSGNRPDIAKRLALQLHATVAQLPDGENKPDADLLVIIGADNTR